MNKSHRSPFSSTEEMQATNGWSHQDHGCDDKSFLEPGDENPTSTERTANDMSKQQVEELVRKIAIDEMNKTWIDEIFAKVKSELVENPLSPTTDTLQSEAVSPSSSPMEMASPKKLYQATVEDDPEDPLGSACKPRSSSTDCSVSSSSSSDSGSSKASNMSANRAPDSGVLRDPSSSRKSRPRLSVRFSDRDPVILHGRQPPAPPRLETPDTSVAATELSAVDMKWGHLFDGNQPTRRLGEFLRGIANYLIAEYTPTSSLVITPDKLYAFYVKYKAEPETIPFEDIFNHRDYSALEWLYQALGCSYHLVQGKPDSRPKIPALTPVGFQNWMTRQIQAFPDQEAIRLHRVVDELPISADGPFLDGKQERLPRQLSRHLLPPSQHEEVRAIVLNSVYAWTMHPGPEATSPREPREVHYHRSSRMDEKSGRYRPEDYVTRHRHKARESHNRQNDRGPRKDPPGRLTTRTHSEGNIRPVKSRSPTADKRYRSSVTSLSGIDDNNNTVSNVPSPVSYSNYPRLTSGGRRTREQEYRYYQGRSGLDDAKPRTVVDSEGRVMEMSPREDTYDEYTLRPSRTSRGGLGIEDASYYPRPHSNGGA